MKNLDETRNYLTEEINQNKMLSKKYKKVCTSLNYIEPILTSVVAGCVSISVFLSLVGIPIGTTISPVGLNICAITAGID